MARPRTHVDERLDTPGLRRRSFLPKPKADPDRFGRFAEAFARSMGTATFLFWMTLFIAIWIAFNIVLARVHGTAPDPWPMMFLTLLLSLQASYASPLILLATNRQEARDRIAMENDRKQAAQSRADMDFLAREIANLRTRMGEMATRDFIRSELRSMLEELDQREAETAAVPPPGAKVGQRD
ncbi:MAG: DUF1003 domain-containing protein [Propionibacteriaceae bacterium]|jgi:uncharacterized membrane protein|nr:DUF1003 domain-containing protein [Propionibacteriaceae bacterium]